MSSIQVDLIRCKWCHKTREYPDLRTRVDVHKWLVPWLELSGWGLTKSNDLMGYYCCFNHLFDAVFEFWVINKVHNRQRLLRYSNEQGDLLHGRVTKCDTCLFQINSITGCRTGWLILGKQDFCSVKCLLKSLLDTRGEALIDSKSVAIMEMDKKDA